MSKAAKIILVVVIAAIVIGGGLYYYFKVYKPKKDVVKEDVRKDTAKVLATAQVKTPAPTPEASLAN